MKKGMICVFVMLLSVSCSSNQQPHLSEEQSGVKREVQDKENDDHLSSDSDPEIVTDNLNVPWSIAKTQDTFYITERPGSIVEITDGEQVRQTVELENEVATAAEAGLLGFVLDPNFSNSHLAYAYYTYEENESQYNRVITLRLQDNVWTEEEVLVDQLPSGAYHHGGRLKMGPDGKLYATTGDATDENIAQDKSSLGGKILRMNVDGTIPKDNPLSDSYVYSYGHRNPQGLTWIDEKLYASEHGNAANDEINHIQPGNNYGWPIIEGDEEQEGMISPLFTSGNDVTWAPSGMDAYENNLYVAGLRGEAIFQFTPETGDEQKWLSGFGRIRDVFIENDQLYFITNNRDGRGSPDENDDVLYQLSLN
ncbi:glucose dehydrogenase [Gracilibacillus halophilus YIM-C55.5]|uniref:Glucose dehydrogenase n=1 Tax=Gracilibacillus halophilus YIM-C55.5 TaxID=1308866 RepID=N4W6Q2_9BACI|nr:PQQ-dependent sugar dehydrogenase [Gracilibacillus halophilus]ENH95908.1 glucose dehydrogenase [Gracilibacillus halophilus YIM-C55.5]